MKKLALFITAVMLAGLVLGGCTSAPASSTAPAGSPTGAATVAPTEAPTEAPPASTIDETRVLRVLDTQEPPQLSPNLMTDVVGLNIHRHISEGLVRLDPENKVQPGMAETWEVSPDGLVYTFHLRDAKWSNGDPVTANDFAFSIKNVLNPATGALYAYVLAPVIKGGSEYNEGKGKVEDLGVKVIDEKTLEITLAIPVTYFFDLMDFSVFGPINEKYYNEVGSDKYGTDADKIICNGPYTLSAWEHEVGWTMTKNPDYWNADSIKIPEIQYTIVKDNETALNMFLGGEVDMVGLTGAQVPTVEAEGFEILAYGDGATAYLDFNTRSKLNDGSFNPLQNKNIRLALGLAIDKEGYIKTVLKNASEPAVCFTTPEIPGKTALRFPDEFKDNPLVPAYSPTEAKAALDKGLTELGITKADLKLSCIFDDTTVAVQTAAYFKENWKQNLDIDVEVITMPFKSRLARGEANDFMMINSLWGPDYNDPMTELDLWTSTSGNNHTGWGDAEYDSLITQAAAEPNRDKKYDLYIAAEKKLMEGLPIFPIYFRARNYTVVPEFKGVVRSAWQDVNFLYAYFDKK
jgi:oligopeptide transport system substrate-binding protein